jgi:hypothetical protein
MEGNGLIEKDAFKTGKEVDSPLKIDHKMAKVSNPLEKTCRV